MASSNDKLIQYLGEAHATESALGITLRAHIAMTPRGAYRLILERHLEETREQARRIERRLAELGAAMSLAARGWVALRSAAGQALALTKGPVDAVRGGSGEEALLKNARDECATEALEIATYDSLEALAIEAGDEKTAVLAREHRAQEEEMLRRLRELIPQLTRDVYAADVEGTPSYA
ncbi:MAG: ferritin-like domain-containing protein, partial [Actinomycetota bacterium]|nr:ferritin-like domain-containing protein [Actinomycetota bacterium]